MTAEMALVVEDLRVDFNLDRGSITVLDGLLLEVPAGECLVITGPSGQGKSTLLKCIAGLLKPTSGRIVANGHEVTGPSRDRGMVFQQDTVFPWMRVRDNVSYGLKARGASGEERARVADQYLAAIGLERFADSWPKELSGGMRKRVAVAAAFASDPSILLMDEPFGSLDFVTRLTLHETLLSLWEQTGKTILFVTHDVDEALVLADRVVIVSDGTIIDDLPIDFPRPRNDELRADPQAIALRRRLLAGLGVTDKEGGLLA